MKIVNSVVFVSAFLLLSCGGGDDSGGPNPQPEPVPSPLAATLVFPDDNKECTEGVVLNDTQSRVTFEWNTSQNTDSYEVNLKNLNTNNTSKTSANTNSVDITLERGTPYEWFVVSKANGTNETATSSTWKFYNQGPGVENYAPFPAEAVNPSRGETVSNSGTITLEWSGSDVDNDITEFDIFFGTESDPTTLLETTANTSLEVTIASGQVYYWRVVSRDGQGNTSQSEIFEFKVE